MNYFIKYTEHRDRILENLVDKMKRIYITIFHPNRKAWNESIASLQHYPTNSIGRKLYEFLIREGLRLEPKYESHDIYHILSGYGTGMTNEARLFFFLLGNGKKTPSIIGSVGIALIFYPELWKEFVLDFKKGRKFSSFDQIDFEFKLHEDYHSTLKKLKL